MCWLGAISTQRCLTSIGIAIIKKRLSHKRLIIVWGIPTYIHIRADSRLAPSQWETSLRSNAVSHWLGANLKSALHITTVFELKCLPCCLCLFVQAAAVMKFSPRTTPTSYCQWAIPTDWQSKWPYGDVPAHTLRNNDVVITPKRCHFDVITSKWHRLTL